MSGPDPPPDADPDPGIHYRAGADAPVPAGVYRVVGRPEGRVTLLRVGDAEGRRVHSGVTERVDPRTLAALDRADPPPGPGIAARAASGLALRLRQVPANLAARPGWTAGGVALLAAAAVGPGKLPGAPPVAFAVADVLGALLLAAAAAGVPRSR